MYVMLIDELPSRPIYFNLVTMDTALTDDLWMDYTSKKPKLHNSLLEYADLARKDYGNVKPVTMVAISKVSCDLTCMLTAKR